ncbi:hypothetical protein BXZ70DRAFT_955858 [Cristinia sonorae]|uniref:Uncharacterized protein n=1 Tax=Cristinia sonorae TaxID=1940300 RepID=A0A8K0UI88_9AGAR|nr:hypothetical protein BXZ70DRAFT_955858 [Cristinia sonorae]
MIIIVGIVHPSNQTVPPATASYTIDDSNSTELPLPVATHDIPNQQFFQSAQLTPAPHTLLINVTSDGSPYTIDYLFVCGTGGPAPPPSSQIPDRPREEFVPKTVAVVVGSILGVVMFTLVIALLYMLWKFRRRRSRQRQPTTTATHRLKEWVRRQTLFTTSESIMRNNPTNPSAADKAGTANRPDDSLSESKSPTLPDVPVYRTFAEFDRGFSFPVTYRLSTQISAQVPFSPNAVDGRHDSSSFHSLPPIPLKDLPNPPSPGRPPLQY